MNIKKYLHLSLVLVLGLVLSGCAQMQEQIKMKDKKPFLKNKITLEVYKEFLQKYEI